MPTEKAVLENCAGIRPALRRCSVGETWTKNDPKWGLARKGWPRVAGLAACTELVSNLRPRTPATSNGDIWMVSFSGSFPRLISGCIHADFCNWSSMFLHFFELYITARYYPRITPYFHRLQIPKVLQYVLMKHIFARFSSNIHDFPDVCLNQESKIFGKIRRQHHHNSQEFWNVLEIRRDFL